ncbi:ABC transporter permease [Paenibacillus eucommiae]|uniref:Aldouronate transport system permease protein n=1 Tax=Paenibacillus eucommiae TaxID=1355755 RepID=A0ABS4IPG6_9BACL|nr:ABC transporter permease subunit [Paenibacillus eucommiae]MBP1989453.1 putative aldouronate transport system permease protein [Paenibacillus eucommiae]
MLGSLAKNKALYLLLLPSVVYLIVFNYVPMYGVVLAFKDYNFMKGILHSPWVGMKHFNQLFSDPNFMTVTWNTLKISLLRLFFGFPFPIFLALLLNEVRITIFKRTIQTVIYLPHFISWIIVAGILRVLLTTDNGIVNHLIQQLGFEPISFLTSNVYFVPMLVASDILKEAGWGTIIYLAALAGIDPEQYEAAMIDGANRWHRLIYITLPGISTAISIMLILSLSGILNAGFDQIFNLYSPLVYPSADIIDTYVYRIGLLEGKYSLATALGLFKSLIGFILIVITNKAAKMLGGSGIW